MVSTVIGGGYPCDACGGSGQYCIGETLVSRDMALDAECPELEGSHYRFEFARCPTCGGDGWIFYELPEPAPNLETK